uniref:Uncharacterized protein n=1 Tax=Fundulus heteroclitus TaxID=8078 RepID=A0A3Q2PLC7_FUNHE
AHREGKVLLVSSCTLQLRQGPDEAFSEALLLVADVLGADELGRGGGRQPAARLDDQSLQLRRGQLQQTDVGRRQNVQGFSANFTWSFFLGLHLSV